MSVPKSQRAISEYEFYRNALRIREKVSEWLLRDFGIKPHVRDLSLLQKKQRMSDEDKKQLEEIFSRYNIGEQICENYPAWWIAERRRTIDAVCAYMMLTIVKAFSIYPTSVAEFDERRIMQNKAISCVFALIEEMQFVLAVLRRTTGAEVGLYVSITELCESEISLLKGWRKQGNQVRNAILRKELTKQERIQKQVAN